MRTVRRPSAVRLFAFATGLAGLGIARPAHAECLPCIEREIAQIRSITTNVVQNNFFSRYPSYEDLAMMVVVTAGGGALTTYVPFGLVSRAPSADYVNAGTLFQIGSVTKTFTALMAAELDDSGAMPLTSLLDDYIPAMQCFGRLCALPTSGTGITLAELADFYSGLPRIAPATDPTKGDLYFRVFHGCSGTGPEVDPAPICENGPSEPPQSPTVGTAESCVTPGTVYNYSNFGYSVLANVLSDHVEGVAFGDTSGPANFAAAVESTVTGPLRMTSTVLPADGQTTPAGAAESYMCQGSNGVGSPLPFTCCPATTTTAVWPDPAWIVEPSTFGVGSMWSNGYDMATWMNVHLDNTMVVDIPTNIRSAISKSVLKTWETSPSNAKIGYGLAWQFDATGLEPPNGSGVQSPTGGARVVMAKDGDAAGFHSYVAMTPRALNDGESGHGVAIMVNYEPASGVIPAIDGTVIRILQALEDNGF